MLLRLFDVMSSFSRQELVPTRSIQWSSWYTCIFSRLESIGWPTLPKRTCLGVHSEPHVNIKLDTVISSISPFHERPPPIPCRGLPGRQNCICLPYHHGVRTCHQVRIVYLFESLTQQSVPGWLRALIRYVVGKHETLIVNINAGPNIITT